MEAGTNKITVWDAAKVMAAPLAAFLSLASGIIYFAGDAWVRSVIAEEVASNVQLAASHQEKIITHEQLLEQHDEEIEDNEEDIDENRQEFRDFVREILDRI